MTAKNVMYTDGVMCLRSDSTNVRIKPMKQYLPQQYQ